MKRWILTLITLAAVLIFACSAAAGETASDAAASAEKADLFFQEYLGRIADPEEEIGYFVGTAEYGLLVPLNVDPEEFLEELRKVKLTAADLDEAPEGEFVVLTFPDHCQFDFFQGDAEKNYVRLTIFGDKDETLLVQAVFPEDVSMTISGLMQMWANELAIANGIHLNAEEEGAIPGEGWVADSIEGTVWQDDRASLEIIPEGDGFKVLILWGSSAWEMTEWTYGCYYDAEKQELTAVHVICDDVVFDEDGGESRTNVLDQDCVTVFSLNDAGQIVITDAADERLEGKTFTRIPDDLDTARVFYTAVSLS